MTNNQNANYSQQLANAVAAHYNKSNSDFVLEDVIDLRTQHNI